jgi:hypothetical protein
LFLFLTQRPMVLSSKNLNSNPTPISGIFKEHIIRVAKINFKIWQKMVTPNLILALHIYPLMLESKVISTYSKFELEIITCIHSISIPLALNRFDQRQAIHLTSISRHHPCDQHATVALCTPCPFVLGRRRRPMLDLKILAALSLFPLFCCPFALPSPLSWVGHRPAPPPVPNS